MLILAGIFARARIVERSRRRRHRRGENRAATIFHRNFMYPGILPYRSQSIAATARRPR